MLNITQLTGTKRGFLRNASPAPFSDPFFPMVNGNADKMVIDEAVINVEAEPYLIYENSDAA